MKFIPKALSLLMLTAVSLTTFAQKIRLTEGDLSVLKGETKLNVLYTYDSLGVGKFDNEDDYIAKKVEEYNKKESGRGDTWAKAWKSDRNRRFEPKFHELFNEHGDLKIGKYKNAKYTLIFHTTFIEPGWNVGVMRKNAYIDAEVFIVDATDNSKVLAKLTVNDAPGRTFGGYDFDTGTRLAESYAIAGKKLAKFINKKI
ncbi:hypothetical protein [Chitinophaga nivalis]|uniref:DUF4468 domain-containing protein n=1 Tax=Chitinophaga nivalis TaxID=2991709 RepID=A0ABT3IRI4_9BACT|nr:hypothetical protein [Chitinophaga nivalis]MCW3463732.1 hypothetical protein [Chitinophaga nivalis]MCW3486578.1 hypothetical protein [Chitinophaga nivalis]